MSPLQYGYDYSKSRFKCGDDKYCAQFYGYKDKFLSCKYKKAGQSCVRAKECESWLCVDERTDHPDLVECTSRLQAGFCTSKDLDKSTTCGDCIQGVCKAPFEMCPQVSRDFEMVCYMPNWAQYRHPNQPNPAFQRKNWRGFLVPERVDPCVCTEYAYAFARISVPHRSNSSNIMAQKNGLKEAPPDSPPYWYPKPAEDPDQTIDEYEYRFFDGAVDGTGYMEMDFNPGKTREAWSNAGGWSMFRRFTHHIHSKNPNARATLALGGWDAEFTQALGLIARNADGCSEIPPPCPPNLTAISEVGCPPSDRERLDIIDKEYCENPGKFGTPDKLTFIKALRKMACHYDFDGVVIDMEFPAMRTCDVNQVGSDEPCKWIGSPLDKTFMTDFMKSMTEYFHDNPCERSGVVLEVTSAVSPNVANIAMGYEPEQLSTYESPLGIMSYDFHGAWDKTTGPMAPLYVGDDSITSDDVTKMFFNKSYHDEHVDKTNFFTVEYGNDLWLHEPLASQGWNYSYAVRANNTGTPKTKIYTGLSTYARGWTIDLPINGNNGKMGYGIAAQGGNVARKTTMESGIATLFDIWENDGSIWKSEYACHEFDPATVTAYTRYGNQFLSYDTWETLALKTVWTRDAWYELAKNRSSAIKSFPRDASISSKPQIMEQKSKVGGVIVWSIDTDDFNNGIPHHWVIACYLESGNSLSATKQCIDKPWLSWQGGHSLPGAPLGIQEMMKTMPKIPFGSKRRALAVDAEHRRLDPLPSCSAGAGEEVDADGKGEYGLGKSGMATVTGPYPNGSTACGGNTTWNVPRGWSVAAIPWTFWTSFNADGVSTLAGNPIPPGEYACMNRCFLADSSGIPLCFELETKAGDKRNVIISDVCAGNCIPSVNPGFEESNKPDTCAHSSSVSCLDGFDRFGQTNYTDKKYRCPPTAMCYDAQTHKAPFVTPLLSKNNVGLKLTGARDIGSECAIAGYPVVRSGKDASGKVINDMTDWCSGSNPHFDIQNHPFDPENSVATYKRIACPDVNLCRGAAASAYAQKGKGGQGRGSPGAPKTRPKGAPPLAYSSKDNYLMIYVGTNTSDPEVFPVPPIDGNRCPNSSLVAFEDIPVDPEDKICFGGRRMIRSWSLFNPSCLNSILTKNQTYLLLCNRGPDISLVVKTGSKYAQLNGDGTLGSLASIDISSSATVTDQPYIGMATDVCYMKDGKTPPVTFLNTFHRCTSSVNFPKKFTRTWFSMNTCNIATKVTQTVRMCPSGKCDDATFADPSKYENCDDVKVTEATCARNNNSFTRCGLNPQMASETCGCACDYNNFLTCPQGQTCHTVPDCFHLATKMPTKSPTAPTPPTLAPTPLPYNMRCDIGTAQRCGYSKADAERKCGCACNATTPCETEGESCFDGLGVEACDAPAISCSGDTNIEYSCPSNKPFCMPALPNRGVCRGVEDWNCGARKNAGATSATCAQCIEPDPIGRSSVAAGVCGGGGHVCECQAWTGPPTMPPTPRPTKEPEVACSGDSNTVYTCPGGDECLPVAGNTNAYATMEICKLCVKDAATRLSILGSSDDWKANNVCGSANTCACQKYTGPPTPSPTAAPPPAVACSGNTPCTGNCAWNQQYSCPSGETCKSVPGNNQNVQDWQCSLCTLPYDSRASAPAAKGKESWEVQKCGYDNTCVCETK